MKRNCILRRYTILFITLVLLIGQPVSATAKSAVGFSEETKTENEILEYKITVTPDSDVCGLSLEIKYSEAQVKVRECTVGEALGDGIAKSNSAIGGKVILTYISTTPLKKSGPVIVVQFEVLSAQNENIDIDCTVTECIDQKCDALAYTYAAREIHNPKYVEVIPEDNTQHGSTDANDGNQSGADDSADTHQTVPTKPSQNEQGNSDASKPTSGNQNESPPFHTEAVQPSGGHTSGENDENRTGEQNDAGDSKVGLIVLCSVGFVILLILACLAFFRFKLWKRRNGNESR